jgi:hypothetical protein
MKTLNYIFGVVLSLALFACSNGADFGLPSTEDSFDKIVSYNNKVDLVIVVDNSDSMKYHQDRLILQVPGFVERLNGLKMDYHIGVISSSVSASYGGGQLLGSPAFLTSSSPSLNQSLQARLQVGEGGSNLESPLQNFKNIFFSDYMKYGGAGFLRSDALLVIIVLSDDDDKTAVSAEAFAKTLDEVKPQFRDGTRGWVYNYIGVLDIKSPCKSPGQAFPSVGVKHVWLTDFSHGVKASICDNTLERAVGNIRARIEQILTDYLLKDKPKVETIRVTLNGQQIPPDEVNGWTYNAETNVVSFHGSAVPAVDGRVLVTYERATAN